MSRSVNCAKELIILQHQKTQPMKGAPFFILSLLIIFLTPFIGFAQEPDGVIVDQLNSKWIASYATRDTATMQQILSYDFVMISPKGVKMDRESVIANIGSTATTTKGVVDSASVRVFGNTALVVAYTHFTILTNNKTMKGTNCYSDLYVKRSGVWKAVAAQVTVLTMQ